MSGPLDLAFQTACGGVPAPGLVMVWAPRAQRWFVFDHLGRMPFSWSHHLVQLSGCGLGRGIDPEVEVDSP